MIRLHGFFRSGTSHRVRIALHLKDIPFESVPVNLPKGEHHQSAYRQLNPQGLVPLLETDEGNFTQSSAILEYLEERYPMPPLLPANRVARARIRALAAIIGSDIHPINNLRVLNHLRQFAALDETRVREWIARWIHAGFTAIESLLTTDHAGGQFCFGATPTLADLYLIPQVFSARRFDVALEKYPRILEIDAACAQMPAFIAASPQCQADAI